MNLFNNGYFQLNYDPSTDILFMHLPNMGTAGLSEAEHCFDIMIEHVQNYHVQKLLLDSSKAVVEVEDSKYNQLIYQVSMKLKKTNLRKVARISSDIPNLEKNANRVQQEVRESESPTFLIQNFTSKEQALSWLAG